MFTIEMRQLTAKTFVYDVKGPNGFVAQFGKEKAADNFVAYLHKNEIKTLEDWKKQPRNVKIAFVSATSMVEPIFSNRQLRV